MAEYRTVRMSFWGDPFVESLPHDGKLLYLYLFTGPKTNNLGLIEMTSRRMAFETGLAEERLEELLRDFEARGKILRSDCTLWLRTFIKHQTSTSPKILKALVRLFPHVPAASIKDALRMEYPHVPWPADALSGQAPYPMDTPMHTSDLPFPEKEEEGEKEKEILPSPLSRDRQHLTLVIPAGPSGHEALLPDAEGEAAEREEGPGRAFLPGRQSAADPPRATEGQGAPGLGRPAAEPPSASRAESSPETRAAGNEDDIPGTSGTGGAEFARLRRLYDEQVKTEAPLTGFLEYRQLRRDRQWPGLERIARAVETLNRSDAQFMGGFAPGLARFLREQWWLKPPSPARMRASPASRTEDVTAINLSTAAKVLSQRARRM